MPARAAVTGSGLVLCHALSGCSSIRGFPEPPATSTERRNLDRVEVEVDGGQPRHGRQQHPWVKFMPCNQRR